MTMTTTPSFPKKKTRASKNNALYDPDHHPFSFPKEGNSSPFVAWQMDAMLQVSGYSRWKAKVWLTTVQREQQAPKHRSSPPLLIQDHQGQDQDH